MDTDVSAATVSATGTVLSFGSRLRGLHLVDGATAGSVQFRDGGATGRLLLDIATPSGSVSEDIDIPGNGIRFTTDIHVTMTNVTSVTIFYG